MSPAVVHLVENNENVVVAESIVRENGKKKNKSSSSSSGRSVYDSKLRGSMTAVKTDWTVTYTHPTPALYVNLGGPLDYGFYQDRFCAIIDPLLKAFCKEGNSYKAVEFGCLYGNSTLAYKYGLGWDGACEVWGSESKALLNPKHNIHVIASDISKPALQYGLKRGIYNEICPFDFNERTLPPKLLNGIYDGDMMFILMSTNYLKTEAFQRLLATFLGDRSKPKLLCYNVVCAFDTRNLSPLAILPPGVENYSVQTDFLKHRNFSPEESAARQGCKESWTLLYSIVFDAKESDDVPEH